MKHKNIARIVWVTALFLLLILLLLMIMNYKIYYQYLTHANLYFYECADNLCISEVKDDSKLIYSIYDCGYEACPTYKKSIDDDFALLNKENKAVNILYNYRTGTILSEDYETYQFINNDYIIVSINNFYGVIDKNNQVTVELAYQQLGYQDNNYLTGYSVDTIIAKKDNKYGIISFKTGEIIEDFKYEDQNIEQLLQLLT